MPSRIWLLALVVAGAFHGTLAATTDVDADIEFPHLFNRAQSSKRVQVLSEITRQGHRLQVEEYLDLKSWRQFIQFKWNLEDTQPLDYGNKSAILKTTKLSVIVENDQNRTYLVRYKPFNCRLETLSKLKGASLNQWLTQQKPEENGNQDAADDRFFLNFIQTLLSPTDKSPYFVRVPITHYDNFEQQTTTEAWLFGVSAIWIRAQHSGDPQVRPQNKMNGHDLWHLDMKSLNLKLFYLFSDVILDMQAESSRDSADKPETVTLEMVEVRNYDDASLVDMVNVITTDFHFDQSYLKKMLKYPLGYNCPQNPALKERGLVFEDYLMESHLLELEAIAIRYNELNTPAVYSTVDIKSIELANTVHPLNSSSRLSMFAVIEDHKRYIKDHNSKVMYSISADEKQEFCKMNSLHYAENQASSGELTQLFFNNGLVLNLPERFPGILRPSDAEMKLIDIIRVSNTKEELVFESPLPKTEDHLLYVTGEGNIVVRHNSTIVWYYQRHSNIDSKTGRRENVDEGSSLSLSHLELVVLDENRGIRLADLRINLVDKTMPLTMLKRANLFNVAVCYDKSSSLHLVVRYPAKRGLLDYIGSRTHEVIEDFYSSASRWSNDLKSNDSELVEKARIGLNINFFRVPKIELVRSNDDALELHLHILDKPLPIYLFNRLPETSTKLTNEDETMLASRLEQCAGFCHQLKCQLFVYDRQSHNCKLNQRSLDELESLQNDTASPHKSSVLQRKASSTVYYAPADHGSRAKDHAGEDISLAELYSYIDHYFVFGAGRAEADEEEAELPEETRHKRLAPFDSESLLSFRLAKLNRIRNPSLSDDGPKSLVLVPQQVHAIRVPIVLDISSERKEVKVASSFVSRIVDQSYYINGLDHTLSQDIIPQLLNNERLFMIAANETFYTMKLFEGLDFYGCALMCYNIEEWDDSTRSEQICVSFSHCDLEKRCILLIKTDFAFNQFYADFQQSSKQQSAINLQSLDLVRRFERGCVISQRNHLNGFKGPIKLLPDNFGYRSTKQWNLALEYEWLIAFRYEQTDYDADYGDLCAKRCQEMNKERSLTCMGLDFCIRKYEPAHGGGIELYEITCHLFKVALRQFIDTSAQFNKLNEARNLLVANVLEGSVTNNKSANICNRYLLSYLHQFTHLSQRKLAKEFSSELEEVGLTIPDANLDRCSFECSMMPHGCLLFEYCSSMDKDTRQVEQVCKLYGGRVKQSAKEEGENNSTALLSLYNRDCHIYLRKDIESLEHLYELRKVGWGYTFQDCAPTILVCLAIYVAFILGLLLVALPYKPVKFKEIEGNQ